MDYSNLSAADLRKLLAEKDAALEAAQKAAERKVTLKVSELGAISVYGLNARFPLTLYKPQWEKLATLMPEIAKFAEANKDKLSTGKDDPRFLAIRQARAEKAAAQG